MRQTHCQFAIAYARIRADLMLTEGPKIEADKRRREQGQLVERRSAHIRASNDFRQTGNLPMQRPPPRQSA